MNIERNSLTAGSPGQSSLGESTLGAGKGQPGSTRLSPDQEGGPEQGARGPEASGVVLASLIGGPPGGLGCAVTREMIVSRAREYVGTKHRHLGRRIGVSVDCVGLVSGVAKDLRITDHDLGVYSRLPDGETLIRELDKCLVPQNRAPKYGDVVVFWFTSPALPTHCGVIGNHPSVKDGLTLIHTYRQVGMVVEHILDQTWRDRIAKVYAYPGTEDSAS